MLKITRLPKLVSCWLLLIAGAVSCLAQNSSNQDQSMETLKVNVNVVQLFFNVKDKRGALIPALSKTGSRRPSSTSPRNPTFP
jgi:NAD/NADP transhydrogenase beta subunit